MRPELDQAFLSFRRAGVVLENRLLAYFASDEPRRLWHQIIDRLAVRYYKHIGGLKDSILEDNAGPEHSGLSIEELKRTQSVADTFRPSLQDLTQKILDEPFRHIG